MLYWYKNVAQKELLASEQVLTSLALLVQKYKCCRSSCVCAALLASEQVLTLLAFLVQKYKCCRSAARRRY